MFSSECDKMQTFGHAAEVDKCSKKSGRMGGGKATSKYAFSYNEDDFLECRGLFEAFTRRMGYKCTFHVMFATGIIMSTEGLQAFWAEEGRKHNTV